ncbi:MAG: polymorphic toxin type 44 domain-containing protein [Gordonia sp. (in: high G+C Gram-positive bacteria)]
MHGGGEWDHKPKLDELLDLQTEDDHYLAVPGTPYRVSYDIFSNIHYGYVGRAAGFSRSQLFTGANLHDEEAGVSDAGDDMSMKLGMDLWDTYHAQLTYRQFYTAVIQLVENMAAAQARGENVTQIRRQ